MEDIYLIPKKITPFNITKTNIYLEDIYSIYPKEYENEIKKIPLRNYKNNTSKYDVIHLGEIIEAVNNKHLNLRLNFLNPDDVIIFFDDLKDNDFMNDELMWQPYPEAISKNSAPNYDECFGYTPLLGLGGTEKVENLKTVKLKEHILIITEFIGPIE